MALAVVTRVHWFRVARMVSWLLIASSGVALFYKVYRMSCQKMRWWIWRFLLPNYSKTTDETLAMTALAAVKAASSVAVEMAKLSQVMLAIQSQGNLRAMNIVRDLQAQSVRLIEAEQMMRCFMAERDRRTQAPWKNGTADEKTYNMQLRSRERLQNSMKGSFPRSGLVSSEYQGSGNNSDAPRPSTPNNNPQSKSFLQVMAMLERGETPPGIKNINDKPPIPNQVPSVSYLQPKPKPWEKAHGARSTMI